MTKRREPKLHRSAAAKALATALYRHRVLRDKTRYTRKTKHRKVLH